MEQGGGIKTPPDADYVRVAKLADAHDSGSCGKPCGFESRLGHQSLKKRKIVKKS